MPPVEPANDDVAALAARPMTLGRVVSEIGMSAGLDRVGICDAKVLERARSALHHRKSVGLADTMQFTYRNPERSTNPSATVPDARSIVVGARSYHLDTVENVPEEPDSPDEVRARVAKYAQVDHYSALRQGLEAIASTLREAGHRAVVVADENNLVDREVAWKAGLGWFGKNANLLLPGAGSWFVLGSVITSANLEPLGEPVADGCGICRRCIDSCPTGAIVAEGVIDARKCLAWLVQKPGIFPVEYRVDLGDRLYGCDDCQDSCPITVRLGPRHRAVGSTAETGTPEAFVDVLEILEASDDELMRRFGRWYIPERNPVWVRRNALIILGNVASIPLTSRVEAVLESYLRSSDAHLRAHASWSARRLGAGRLAGHLAGDPDPVVRAEWERLDEVPEREEVDRGRRA